VENIVSSDAATADTGEEIAQLLQHRGATPSREQDHRLDRVVVELLALVLSCSSYLACEIEDFDLYAYVWV